MRKNFILLIFLLFCSSLSATTFRFGVPHYSVESSEPFTYYTTSSSQLDLSLSSKTNGFGGNYFSNISDSMSYQLSSLKSELTLEMYQEISNVDNINQVYSNYVTFNPISFKIEQKGDNLDFAIQKIGVGFRAKASAGIPLFCSSVTFNADFENLVISGQYDFYTGTLKNITTDYDINVSNASCGGLLSLVTNALASGFVKSKIASVIQSNLQSYNDIQDIETAFSVKKLIEGFANITNSNLVQKSVVNVGSKLLLNDSKVINSGLRLDLSYYLNSSIASQNVLEIVASHQSPVIKKGSATQLGSGLFFIELEQEPHRNHIYRVLSAGNLVPITTTENGFFKQFNIRFSSSGEYVFVGESSLIPGLLSHPSNVVQYYWAGCRHCNYL